jgi:O-antigen/teichoic acid export membrane protein
MSENINRFSAADSALTGFTRNIAVVFTGTSLLSFFNLLYQLLIAHKLPPAEFAAFNTLLSIFIIASSALSAIQVAVAKYSAELAAHNKTAELKSFLSGLIKKMSILSISTLLILLPFSIYITGMLKIGPGASGYILAALLSLSWLSPVFLGGAQGLEFFRWFASAQVASGVLKLILAFILILLGYSIAGALGALLVSNIAAIIVLYFAIRRFVNLGPEKESFKYKDMFKFLFPTALSNFCFVMLVSFDMVLVKYFFAHNDAGLYSLAQMVGKIFLFSSAAISIAMFPMTAGLNAKNLNTASTLKRSLLYASILCIIASLIFNIFPSFILKALTGKQFPESIILGRLFSISMSFFSLLFVMITYFLSIKDLRFVNYLALFTFLQVLAVALFHKSLIQVQAILCINAILLFSIHFLLAHNVQKRRPKFGI